MAYLGRQPIIGNYQVLDALTATATATYALTKNSVAVFPQTPANCIVSLNGVIQAPFDSYTISGSNIVFASALTGSDSIDFITVLGDVLNVGTVSDGTIGLAKLSATGTKDATTFLRGDNTFASAGGTNTPAFEAYLGTTQTITSGATVKLQLNTERFDTDSYYDNVTNYRFTPLVAGKYFVYAKANAASSTQQLQRIYFSIRKNSGDIYFSDLMMPDADKIRYVTENLSLTIEMNGTTDYLETFCYLLGSGTLTINAGNAHMGAYKIIE
jgi:hypothetical protein